MAKNIPLDNEAYQFFRGWLRTTPIIWRDVIDSAIVPVWNEAICKEETLDSENRTPGERAYITLKTHYPKLDLRWRQTELEYLSLRPPKKFEGAFCGELYCLDISACFAQMYHRLFLHADFPAKRLRFPLAQVADHLWQDKTGRNAVVGIARSTKNKWVQGERVWYVKKQNRFLSPILWAHLMLILSDIAQSMLGFGALFINTDGYAFTDIGQFNQAKQFLADHGLQFRQSIGDGQILGISALSIPGIKEPKELNVSQPTFHLEPIDFGWLEWWSKLPKGDL